VAKLRARTGILDGEAVACGTDGIACFELIRSWETDHGVFMYAFDLRKVTLNVLLGRAGRFSEPFAHLLVR
jgi:hypothetical protein